jgi:ABC-type nitrate/sulfonate/bicarbonate transport system ATPase subunit
MGPDLAIAVDVTRIGPAATSTPVIEVNDIYKAFRVDGQVMVALESVSLKASAREFVSIIGPSGSGKSTLLNIVCGLLEPDRGEVLLNGETAPRRLGRMAYMPQRDLLLPWRTVLDNVILCAELRGSPRAEARRHAEELLPLFGLEGFGSSYPAALSGGMKQRAALLRTFFCEQEIMLLDEPFGALDAITRAEMQAWLLQVWSRFQQTILFITHDVEEAVFLSDRVYVMTARPGRISRVVDIDLPRPRDRAMITEPQFVALRHDLLEALH